MKDSEDEDFARAAREANDDTERSMGMLVLIVVTTLCAMSIVFAVAICRNWL